MKKQPEITKEAKVLMKLMRLALGTEPMHYFGGPVEPFPKDINWEEVIRLSYEQRVSAIAVDGLQSANYNPYEGLDEKQSQELNLIFTSWFNDVTKTDQSYNYYSDVLKTICEIFESKGLIPIILKGYGLSYDYPIPSHRGVGDIDIYLIDNNGECAATIGNQIVKNLGIEVVDENSVHHSHFTFKGISIENHYELIGEIGDEQRSTYLKPILKQKIGENIYKRDGLYFPSPTFNNVFLILHLYTHFYHRIANIRQFIDYSTFLLNNVIEINWEESDTLLANTDLIEFANCIKEIIREQFGIQCFTNSKNKIDHDIKSLLIKDLFVATGNSSFSEIFMYYYNNRKFYRYFRQTHWLNCLLKHFHSSLHKRY